MKQITEKQKSLAKIVIFTTFGKIVDLESALNEGLDSGWTVNEINEAIVQLYGYIGMPRSMNAIQVFSRVVKQREIAGKSVIRGVEQMPADKSIDRYKSGQEIMNTLAGYPVSELDWAKFCPIAPHVIYTAFAELYLRDILDYATREFVTLTTLASQDGLVYQVQLHLNMGKGAGLTLAEIDVISEVVAEYVSPNAAQILRHEASQIFG